MQTRAGAHCVRTRTSTAAVNSPPLNKDCGLQWETRDDRTRSRLRMEMLYEEKSAGHMLPYQVTASPWTQPPPHQESVLVFLTWSLRKIGSDQKARLEFIVLSVRGGDVWKAWYSDKVKRQFQCFWCRLYTKSAKHTCIIIQKLICNCYVWNR